MFVVVLLVVLLLVVSCFAAGYAGRRVAVVQLNKSHPKINESSAAIAPLRECQTEDLKVPGSIPGLGIRSILLEHAKCNDNAARFY